jgi:hypothetical protein
MPKPVPSRIRWMSGSTVRGLSIRAVPLYAGLGSRSYSPCYSAPPFVRESGEGTP